MLSGLHAFRIFQLDEPKKEESSESPLNENSGESCSEEEEMPDSDENGFCSSSSYPLDDNKAVAIIKSVGEFSENCSRKIQIHSSTQIQLSLSSLPWHRRTL